MTSKCHCFYVSSVLDWRQVSCFLPVHPSSFHSSIIKLGNAIFLCKLAQVLHGPRAWNSRHWGSRGRRSHEIGHKHLFWWDFSRTIQRILNKPGKHKLPTTLGRLCYLFCWYVCLSISMQDYCKSNQPISLKHGVIIRRISRKNGLTLGRDLVPDMDSGSFLSASLSVSKRGAYWDRLCHDVVGWLVFGCHARALWPNGAS